MLDSISGPLVFLQGVVSFLSPCVLPLVPAYLAFLGGADPLEMMVDVKAKRRLIVNSLGFILGFTVVFVLMGATATALGGFVNRNARLISIFSGFAVVLLGLVTMGILHVSFLEREKRFDIANVKGAGVVRSLLTGAAFGFGWTPCIGPILTSVLILASRSDTLGKGILLLLLYSLGLGLPFLLLSVFIRALWNPLQKLKKHALLIRRVSGAVLIVMGILMMTGTFSLLAALGAPALSVTPAETPPPSITAAPAVSATPAAPPSPSPAPTPAVEAEAQSGEPFRIDPRSNLTREAADKLAAMLEDVELPPISLESLEGGVLSTDDFKGVRVLNLLATWCPYCVDELPLLQKVTSEFDGVQLIGIDTFESGSAANVKKELNALLADLPAPFPILLDTGNDWGMALSPRGSVPVTLILDENNHVRFYYPGAFQYEDDLRQLLDFMLYHLKYYVE